MSFRKAAVIWTVLLCGGGIGGWALRGLRDKQWMEEIAGRAFQLQLLTSGPRVTKFMIKSEPDPEPTPAEHDADLRCMAYDPEAIALPATVRRVTRSGDFTSGTFEVELETAEGAFEIKWWSGRLPKVGQSVELFGRVDSDLRPVRPRTLNPVSLEPVGTLARFDKR